IKTSFDRYTDPETKYEVLEALGEGVFGTVTKCRNRATNQIVVLKVMKKDEKMCLNFKRELEMLEHISPVFNLVKFIEFFDFQDRQSMVFEMLDISVYDLMQEEFPFSLSQARPVAKQLLIALQGLQDIAVIHADIKPDNIMLVNHREQPFKVKLIDFGVAKRSDQVYPGQMMQPISVRAPELANFIGTPAKELLDEALYAQKYFSNDRDAFHDLLSKMLEINAEKRITPAQALLHPFITMDHLPKGDNYTKEAHELMRVAETMYGPLQRENLEKIYLPHHVRSRSHRKHTGGVCKRITTIVATNSHYGRNGPALLAVYGHFVTLMYLKVHYGAFPARLHGGVIASPEMFQDGIKWIYHLFICVICFCLL
uniref:Protein kinase domain-containing protein n=1 Tax=Periophthalmus magnuspinnatus TaxID=409849 RepID=A0A3B3ZLN5_9GOBI